MTGRRTTWLGVLAGVAALAALAGHGSAQEGGKVPFREYPIGDEVEHDASKMRVAAVWLPPVKMDHEMGPAAGPNVVHLECDVKAMRGNENGFATGDWIPYLTVRYRILAADAKADAKPLLEGTFMPMVAKDGPHYGASIAMPGHGKYKLVYELDPPSSNGLGRHTDPVTGVADWWKPYQVSFDWDYKGIPAEKK